MRKTPLIIHTGKLEHPATRAWNTLRGETVEPRRLVQLKHGRKSRAYRLEGVGPDGAALIAKWCPRATAALERIIYEEVLPHLPVTAPRYHGFLDDGPEASWLFIEDVGSERYVSEDPAHAALAARWVAAMHTATGHLATVARLPERGPAHYLAHLRNARSTIQRDRVGRGLDGRDEGILDGILAQIDTLEQQWPHVEEACASLPVTLAHGDFRPKNAHVRPTAQGLALYPMDWETAGRGPPVADLARVDVEAYWLAVRGHWPQLDFPSVQRMGALGGVFRWLAGTDWESTWLKHNVLDRAMARMAVCHAELTRTTCAVDFLASAQA
ncbi:MAG: aminoglycoside phosphotransferase family protein [Myxococcota bacterium]